MDLLNDWPEPIVPVQSLAESGTSVLPDRYMKPPSERPSVDPAADRGEHISIPVIDFAGLTKGAAEWRATMRLVSDACREWGFFQVVNHRVSVDLVARMRKGWRDFFDLPMEEKRKLANSPKTYEGYGSRLGVEKGATLDWGDYFFLHLLPPSIKDYNKWPSLPTSCREVTEEYCQELVKLCETVMKVLSTGLGLDAGFLQKAFGGEDVGACMRVNFYPRCPQPDLALGLSAHSDPGGLTVLLADDRVKGLQVRRGNAWVTVQPIPNAFIVNIGDQIQVLSNANYKCRAQGDHKCDGGEALGRPFLQPKKRLAARTGTGARNGGATAVVPAHDIQRVQAVH
ncbi:putative 2-oxoglutarate-dependent dioxygenase [Iris pallida]|uniref:2-oxoglutarate-dependent dioxygenase n=1 Tax=Iris pallida TaxID=29817 RepID=A0AAX6G2X2_IRIPA|nr:putative 2-oxoglutarate-dependent dioxygenase [Iris pallida]